MRYSLLSRFQGTLLGTLIGEKLGNQEKSVPWWLSMNHELLVCLAEKGEITPGDWQAIASPQKIHPNTGELILGTLPLMLLFHDAPSLLEEQLYPLVALGEIPPQILEEMIVWGALLRLILTEKPLICQGRWQLLDTLSPIPQSLHQPLQQVQSFLEQSTPLTQVIGYFQKQAPLEQSAFPLSLYCFCSVPEDFRLGVLKAVRIGYPTITALTGALAGAYNSLWGVPIDWRLAMQPYSSSLLLDEQLPSFWGMWTGVYSWDNINGLFLDTNAVTSPLIIQKRPSPRLISQKNLGKIQSY